MYEAADAIGHVERHRGTKFRAAEAQAFARRHYVFHVQRIAMSLKILAALLAAGFALGFPTQATAEVSANATAIAAALDRSPSAVPENVPPCSTPTTPAPISTPASILSRAEGRAEEESFPSGLPSIGMWMISPKGTPADWLGAPCGGKRLLEPINVIIVDLFAISDEDATRRLLDACAKAEFPRRQGHSSGYHAIIGSQLFEQFPAGYKGSFSDALFVFANDHGRLFGPLEWNGAYIFVGAFSRERFDVAAKVKHRFESFDRARDAFAQRLSESSVYKLSAFVQLGNAILGDPALSTGDHDGIAVVLTSER
jgi:hypothetical protein